MNDKCPICNSHDIGITPKEDPDGVPFQDAGKMFCFACEHVWTIPGRVEDAYGSVSVDGIIKDA